MSDDPEFIAQLADLSSHYDILLCDVWGVLHDGVKAYGAACDALMTFRHQGGTVLLLSNAPRPEAAVRQQIAGFGVSPSLYHGIVSSGDLARDFLFKERGLVCHIGPERDRVLFSGTGITLVSPDEAHVCICSGLVNDEREEPEDYRQTLKALAQRQVPMVCANPDRMIERAGRFISCAGALADMYEEMGGKVTWFGKPYQPIYDAALTRLIQFTEKPIDPSRVLAIGDSVTTDIAGAVNAGLDSLLILGGIHRPKCSVNGQISIDHARLWLTTQSVKPRYLMASLV